MDALENSLRQLIGRGAGDPNCALAVEHVEALLTGRSFRLRRRDGALVELASTYYAVGARKDAAAAMARTLSRFAMRHDRQPRDAREALLAQVVALSGDRVPGPEAIRKILRRFRKGT